MLATILHGPGDVRVENVPEPSIVEPTDAIIRLSATCICGSDLWPYRGVDTFDGPIPSCAQLRETAVALGHEQE